MEEVPTHLVAALGGALGGFGLGLAARLGRFCTLAAIEDTLFAGNTIRWRMWVLAMAVALVATQLGAAGGWFDLADSVYVRRPFNLPSILIGGFLFGVGMALVGTCAFGSLVRLGGGDLKSFLVFLVLGVSAFMATAGPTAALRVALIERFDATADWLVDPRFDVLLETFAGIPGWISVIAIAVTMIAWVLRDQEFRNRRRRMLWGMLVGLLISFGWFATGWLAADAFEPVPVQSFTFVRPIGASMMYLMTSTGSTIGFGIGATVGVLLGAFAGAAYRRELRWEAHDDDRETRRQVLGAFLMGTGGVYALGCTIGEGLTAVSVLAISAPIALAMIWLGAWFGLTYLIEGRVLGVFGIGSVRSRR